MTGTEAAIASTILGGVSTIGGMQQASSQRRAQAAQLAHQQKQAALKQRIEERRLERQKRSEQAKARARFGASGVSSTSGSGAAALAGLEKTYDQQLADSRALFNGSQSAPTNLLDDRGSKLQGIVSLGQTAVGLGGQIAGFLKE